MTVRTLIGSVAALGVMALLLRQVDLRELAAVLMGVEPLLLGLAIALQITVMWLKAIRLAVTLRNATGRAPRRVLSACMVGFAGNLVFPARLGELARIEIIVRHNRIERSLTATTVGLTQLFDLLTLAVYFLAISLWAGSLFTGQLPAVGALGVAAGALLLGLFFVQRGSPWIGAKTLAVGKYLPARWAHVPASYVQLIVKGLGVLGNRRSVASALLLTAVIWALETLSTYVMLRAFHIAVNPLVAAIMIVVLSLGFAFPITPGNVGISQALAVFVLSAFDVPTVSALAYGIGAQGVATLVVVALGIACFYRVGMSLDSVRKARAEISPTRA